MPDWSKVICVVTGMGYDPYPADATWEGLRPYLQQYVAQGWDLYVVTWDDLIKVLTEDLPSSLMAIKQVIIIGHSWGAYASTQLVAELNVRSMPVHGWMCLDGVDHDALFGCGFGEVWPVPANVAHAASYSGIGATLQGSQVEAQVHDLFCGHNSFMTRPDVLAKIEEWVRSAT